MKKQAKKLFALLAASALLFIYGCGEEPGDVSSASGGASAAVSGDGGFEFEFSGGESGGGGGNASGGGQDTGSGGSASKGNSSKSSKDQPDEPGLTTVTVGSITGSLITNSTAGGNYYSDMFKAKTADIKKKFKVNLRFKTINIGDESGIVTALFAGEKPFDLLYHAAYLSRDLALNGLLLDQKKISAINLNAPQFKKAAAFIDGMTFKGKVYGSAFGSEIDKSTVVFCNQTVIDTYAGKGKYDMLDIYKKGQWTVDKFREIAKACTKLDGSGKTVVWGAAEGIGNGTFLTAYAGGTVTRDAQGRYSPAMLSDAGVQAIEFLRKLQFEDKSWISSNGIEMFKKGTVAMTTLNLSEAANMVPATKGDVVALPVPKAPTQSKHLLGARGYYYMIPKSVKNADLIGRIYMEMSTMDMEKYYLSLFTNTGMTEENGKLALQNFPGYFRAEFVDGVEVLRFHSKIVEICNSPTGSVKAGFDAVRPQFEAAIEDCYSREANLK